MQHSHTRGCIERNILECLRKANEHEMLTAWKAQRVGKSGQRKIVSLYEELTFLGAKREGQLRIEKESKL